MGTWRMGVKVVPSSCSWRPGYVIQMKSRLSRLFILVLLAPTTFVNAEVTLVSNRRSGDFSVISGVPVKLQWNSTVRLNATCEFRKNGKVLIDAYGQSDASLCDKCPPNPCLTLGNITEEDQGNYTFARFLQNARLIQKHPVHFYMHVHNTADLRISVNATKTGSKTFEIRKHSDPLEIHYTNQSRPQTVKVQFTKINDVTPHVHVHMKKLNGHSVQGYSDQWVIEKKHDVIQVNLSGDGFNLIELDVHFMVEGLEPHEQAINVLQIHLARKASLSVHWVWIVVPTVLVIILIIIFIRKRKKIFQERYNFSDLKKVIKSIEDAKINDMDHTQKEEFKEKCHQNFEKGKLKFEPTFIMAGLYCACMQEKKGPFSMHLETVLWLANLMNTNYSPRDTNKIYRLMHKFLKDRGEEDKMPILYYTLCWWTELHPQNPTTSTIWPQCDKIVQKTFMRNEDTLKNKLKDQIERGTGRRWIRENLLQEWTDDPMFIRALVRACYDSYSIQSSNMVRHVKEIMKTYVQGNVGNELLIMEALLALKDDHNAANFQQILADLVKDQLIKKEIETRFNEDPRNDPNPRSPNPDNNKKFKEISDRIKQETNDDIIIYAFRHFTQEEINSNDFIKYLMKGIIAESRQTTDGREHYDLIILHKSIPLLWYFLRHDSTLEREALKVADRYLAQSPYFKKILQVWLWGNGFSLQSCKSFWLKSRDETDNDEALNNIRWYIEHLVQMFDPDSRSTGEETDQLINEQNRENQSRE